MLANDNHSSAKAESKPEKRTRALRDSHHMLARLDAAGLRGKELTARSGYSSARISVLRHDPSYQELLAKYRAEVDESWAKTVDTYVETAMANMIAAERAIADRLEDDAEDEAISIKTLDAISQGRADRFGYGKRATQVNLNADLASMLDRAIKRSGKTIEGGLSTADGQRQLHRADPARAVPPPASLGVEMAPGSAEAHPEVAPVPIRRISGPPLLLDDEPAEMTNSFQQEITNAGPKNVVAWRGQGSAELQPIGRQPCGPDQATVGRADRPLRNVEVEGCSASQFGPDPLRGRSDVGGEGSNGLAEPPRIRRRV